MDDGAGPDLGPRDTSGGSEHGDPGSSHAQPDLRQVARDWIELWESELSALAVDREAQEAWQALMPLWTGISLAGVASVAAMRAAMEAALHRSARTAPPQSGPARSEHSQAAHAQTEQARREHAGTDPAGCESPADERADRRARAEPTPRTAPAAAASDARDDAIEHLMRHVAELEARLAALERDRGGAAGGSRKRKR